MVYVLMALFYLLSLINLIVLTIYVPLKVAIDILALQK